jgi:hypothetical protein
VDSSTNNGADLRDSVNSDLVDIEADDIVERRIFTALGEKHFHMGKISAALYNMKP